MDKKEIEEIKKSKYVNEEEVYLNVDEECKSDDLENSYYSNVTVFFHVTQDNHMKRRNPNYSGTIVLEFIQHKDNYIFPNSIPKVIEEWIKNHLWENNSKEY